MPQKTLKVQELEAAPGTKKQGYLRISERPAGIHSIPVTLINGRGDGPTLCVSGGIDGSEYNGPAAALRLQRELDPKEVNGSVIIAPLVNTLAFEARWVYTNPIDFRGLSSALVPEIPKGGSGHPLITYQVARTFYDSILAQSDYRLDLHGGDIIEDVLESVFYRRTDSDQKRDDASLALARNFGWEWIREGRTRSGGMPPGSEFKMPISMGTEAGGMGRAQSDLAGRVLKGILNVMKYLQMLKGEPELPPKAKVYRPYHIYANRGGFFISHVKGADMVSKGQVIGEIRDLFGEILEEIAAPTDGVIHMVTSPAIFEGDALFEIGTDIREIE